MKTKSSHFLDNHKIMHSIAKIAIHTLSFAFLLFTFSACGDSSETPAAGKKGENSELSSYFDQIENGNTFLSIEGTVNSVENSSVLDENTRNYFRPANGNGKSRQGSNAEGPYSINIYTGATHEDEPDEEVYTKVSFVLPKGAQPNTTYKIASFSKAKDDEIQSHVRVDGGSWMFSRKVEGELYLKDIGESIDAAWKFKAKSGSKKDAPEVTVTGATQNLPFEPQQEARYTFTKNGSSEEYLGGVAIFKTPNDYSMNIKNGMRLGVPLDVSAKTYELSTEKGDDKIKVYTEDPVESLEGQITFEKAGEAFNATFDITAKGENEFSAEGQLESLVFDD
ncbi:MAG: hypothetical protein ACQERC_11890 [Bacteroidota bacterium]